MDVYSGSSLWISSSPSAYRAAPEEVASAVRYFATDEAGYVNGASLAVDGGLVVGRVKA